MTAHVTRLVPRPRVLDARLWAGLEAGYCGGTCLRTLAENSAYVDFGPDGGAWCLACARKAGVRVNT